MDIKENISRPRLRIKESIGFSAKSHGYLTEKVKGKIRGYESQDNQSSRGPFKKGEIICRIFLLNLTSAIPFAPLRKK